MSLAMLDQLVDWFIPAEIAGEREARQRARMFVISHLLGPFIGSTIPLYLYIFGLDQGWRGVVFWASMLAFWVYNPILKVTGRYMPLTLVSIQNFLFCVWWGWYHWGGISSPLLPWLAVTPILAFLYIGSDRRARLQMLALIGVNMALFFGFYFLNPPGQAVEAGSLQMLGIVSTLAAAVYVSMMALYYAKILASQVELEAIMKGHLETAAELRRATSEAERAGAAKAEFLAKMSHELRTPLNAVIGYSQMLLEDAQADGEIDDAADLDKIHSAGHHLLKLVNEVLDLSKIEAGKMELTPETMDVGAFLEDVAEGFREAAAASGNSLSVHADRRLGTIVTDGRKLRQALSQLLDNAVKFTLDGRIDLSARRETTDRGEEMVIRVRDSGIGIPAEALPTLFDKFSVADDASATKYGGTGLGLALALKLCRLMGGDIAVESQPGSGSCFTLRVPVTPPAPRQRAGEDAADASSLLTAA